MMLFCLNVFGQQQENISMTLQSQKTEVQALVETVSQLQAEKQTMQKQLENLEKEVDLYREDVRAKEAAINEDQGHWLTLLSIVIGAIVMILGVGVPLYLNNRHEKYIEKLLSDAKREAISAKKQAENAEKALNSISPQVEAVREQVASATEQAKQAKQAVADIVELKTHVDAIEKRINDDALAAEKAAKEAQTNRLFAQALSEKDTSKAIETYTKIIEMNPTIEEAYFNRGNEKVNFGDYEGALIDYNKAIEINSSDNEAYINRGNVKSEIGDLIGALADYDKAININHCYPEAYYNRGNVKFKMQDLTGALLDYDKAISLRPNYAEAYFKRGVLKSQMNDLLGAISDYDSVITLNPNADAYNNRGVQKSIMGKYVEAISDYEKSINLDHNNLNAYKNRAKCYRKLAEVEQNETEKANLIVKAEADEKRVELLKKDKE